MRGIARRLDNKALQIEVRGQPAPRGDPPKNRTDQRVELGVEIHSLTNSWRHGADRPGLANGYYKHNILVGSVSV